MPTDHDWPQILRVFPILDWTYSQVWTGILNLKLSYCILYDQGYTSLGNPSKTFKNSSLKMENGKYFPAYLLTDFKTERFGRARNRESQ